MDSASQAVPTHVTVDELRNVENSTLRTAVLKAVKRRGDVAAAHQNHGSHGDSTTAPSSMRVEFVKSVVAKRG